MKAAALLSLTLLLACSPALTRTADPVYRAIGQVASVSLVDIPTRRTVATFTADEVTRVNAILARVEESPGFVATTPPWQTAIRAVTHSGDHVVLHFVDTCLRFSELTPWTGGASATDSDWRAASVDLILSFDDSQWLWSTLTNYLGPTPVKEYHSLDLDHPFP